MKRGMGFLAICVLTIILSGATKLFEIKTSDNKTVFEVCDDGIRVFNTSGDTIMTIADSDIKAYIKASSKAGVRRDFNIGDMGSRSANSNFQISKENETDTYDGPMMLWYPQKEAFRVGNVFIDNPANVGTNSFVTGYKSIAKGKYSQALGKDCIVDGEGATAMGTSDTTSADYSFALGKNCHAAGAYSIALGYKARTGTAASSVALGWDVKAEAQGSMAMGHQTHTYNTGEPGSTFHNGYYSFAMGEGAKTSGSSAASIGKNTIAHGYYSFAQGYESHTFAPYTVAMGLSTVAQAQGLTVFGRYNKIYGDSLSWQFTNPIFVIGNGSTDASRNDAFTILRNGEVTVDNLKGTGSRMVVADENGKLSTQAVPTADNLGNHSATQNIRLNNHYISNDGTDEGLTISSSYGIVSTSNDLKVGDDLIVNDNVAIGTNLGSQRLRVHESSYAGSGVNNCAAYIENTYISNGIGLSVFNKSNDVALYVENKDNVGSTIAKFCSSNNGAEWQEKFKILGNGDLISHDLYETTSGASSKYVKIDSNGKFCVTSKSDIDEMESLKKENQELKSKVEDLSKKMAEFEKILNALKNK